ncbi:hypothetical protein DSECCO2_151570 [anaerobic digester metagenome]
MGLSQIIVIFFYSQKPNFMEFQIKVFGLAFYSKWVWAKSTVLTKGFLFYKHGSDALVREHFN